MRTLRKVKMKGTKRVLCKYERLLVSRAGLPIFLSFKPNNYVDLILKSDTSSAKIEELLQLLSKWFVGLQIIKRSEKYGETE